MDISAQKVHETLAGPFAVARSDKGRPMKLQALFWKELRSRKESPRMPLGCRKEAARRPQSAKGVRQEAAQSLH